MKKLLNYIEDLLIVLGSLFVMIATFFLSFVAGLYVIGVFFILFGIYFSLNPPSTHEKRG